MTVLRRKFLMRVLLVLLSVSWHNYGWSQPWPDEPFGGGTDENAGEADFGTSGDPGDPGDPGTDPDLPIDSNILVLVAAVVGYGLKKWWDVKHPGKKHGLQTTANYQDYIK
jgi:hypothetical protein